MILTSPQLFICLSTVSISSFNPINETAKNNLPETPDRTAMIDFLKSNHSTKILSVFAAVHTVKSTQRPGQVDQTDQDGEMVLFTKRLSLSLYVKQITG